MAYIINPAVLYPKAKLGVSATRYEFFGESNLTTLQEPMTETSNPIKTILLNGKVKVSYPGTDTQDIECDELGAVFPRQFAWGKKVVKLDILQDDTRFNCVQPFPGYKVNFATTDLLPSEELAVEVGSIIFTLGSDYLVGGKPYTQNAVLATENNATTIKANTAMRVVVFKAEAK